MDPTTTRRRFLGGFGATLGLAAVGSVALRRLGLAEDGATRAERLRFGALDPLVDLVQSTPADALLPLLVAKLRSGTTLDDLVGAAALANARALGGTDYDGYHAFMALAPAHAMAARMPAPLGPLPVLKVVHRTARFVQAAGRAERDALEPVEAAEADALVPRARGRELAGAEKSLAAATARSPERAFEELQRVVRDDVDVHRVVLAWRAWDLQRLAGAATVGTLLRQPVRFCVASRAPGAVELQELLPKLLDEHRLRGRARGTTKAEDAWIERLAATVATSERAPAARAVAAALAEGFDPEDVGAALVLAATRLLLHDPGRTREEPGRPVGSVHGASVGVHATDAANAWRHLARTGGAENAFASLIAGAYHTAGQSGRTLPEPFDRDARPCAEREPAALLATLRARIDARDQAGACSAARRWAELGHPPADLFALLLESAVAEDGALHAEKYFDTAREEHAAARPAHKAQFLVALTRVAASHHGFPAPGVEEARRLLQA
jgi:hypothetical protein